MKSLKYILFLFISLFFISNINFVFALDANGYFNKDLKEGDNHSDVISLQKFLNRDPQTAIIGTWRDKTGTSGYETTYFGLRTKDAVKKFQQKYANEVLYPNGLNTPTGFFGPATRQKANQIIAQTLGIRPVDENQERQVFNPETDSAILYVSGISLDNPAVTRPGESYQLIGYGLKPNISKVYLIKDFEKIQVSISIVNEGYAHIRIPYATDGGKYNLVIDNNGVFSEPFIVHVQERDDSFRSHRWDFVDYNPPQIRSVSNQPIMYGDKVVIKGNNFVENTKVNTPLGEYIVNPVDQSTIELVFEKPIHLRNQNINEPYFESFIKISNQNGVSKNFEVEFGDKSQGDLVDDISEQREGFQDDPEVSKFFDDLKDKLIDDGVGKLTNTAINSMTDYFNNKIGSSASGSLTGGSSYNPYMYGGNLLSTMTCPCSGTILMYIYDYKTNSTLPLVYQPGGSKLLAGSPTGFYQVGSYTPYGYCLMPCSSCCYEVPSRGTAGGGMPGYGTAN